MPDQDATAAQEHHHKITRRQVLSSALVTAGALALSGSAPFHAVAQIPVIPANYTGTINDLRHVVLVMMENRSFDHIMGWLPGANGQQAGLSYTDQAGMAHATYHLTEFQGCAHPDPDHSFGGGRAEYNNGGCDGWLRAGTNDTFTIGYYQQPDLAFLGQAAHNWTVCDNYFAPKLAGTYPNRFYQHAAQTDRIDNSTKTSKLTTIWDRLKDAKVSARYYFNDVPVLALWGTKYVPITRPFFEFKAACANGKLPAVCFVDPHFIGESKGTSNDDHPHADIRNGEAFLHQVYQAVTTGPDWEHTLLIINFDEWGGFFDHVVPPDADVPPADPRTGQDDGRRGFRVPCLLISPWSPRGAINHTLFDHTSVLRLIEDRWHLPPLTVRDQHANSLALALDFASPSQVAPTYTVPSGKFGAACTSPSKSEGEWSELQKLLHLP